MVEARIGASGYINKLIEDKNEVYLLSARIKAYDDDVVGRMIKKMVIKWASSSNIKINRENIHFCPLENTKEFKAEWCKENNADYIIEDTPENLVEVLTRNPNMKGYLYETPYNKDFVIPENINIKKTTHFSQIYCDISKNYTNYFREIPLEERSKLTLEETEKYYNDLRFKNKLLETETMHFLKGKLEKMPIIVLTANAVDGAKEHYIDEGFDDYIAKPTIRKELDRILKNNLIYNDVELL